MAKRKREAPGNRSRAPQLTVERPRLMIFSMKERLASPYLARLAKNLTIHYEASGMLKPDFAASIGISGSQFRYLRARTGNPTIRMLVGIAVSLRVSPYELLENKPLGRRRVLTADKMNEVYSEIVRRKFEQSDMTNREFAAFLGISLSQLYLILQHSSSPSLLAVEEMAKRLKLTVWQLLGVEPYDANSAIKRARPTARRRRASV